MIDWTYVDIRLVRGIERLLELLIFYFIFANVTGLDLKTAFKRLFLANRDGFAFSNTLALLLYIASTVPVFYYFPREVAFIVDHVLRVLLTLYLMRIFNSIKKPVMTHLFVIAIGFVVSLLPLLFEMHAILFFLFQLLIVLLLFSNNVFENVYGRLLQKPRILDLALAVTSIYYMLLMLTMGEQHFVNYLIMAFIALSAFGILHIFLRREVRRLNDAIKNAPSDAFLPLLHQLASEHHGLSPVKQTFIIRHYQFIDILPTLIQALDFHKKMDTFKDYELNLKKRTITVAVITGESVFKD